MMFFTHSDFSLVFPVAVAIVVVVVDATTQLLIVQKHAFLAIDSLTLKLPEEISM